MIFINKQIATMNQSTSLAKQSKEITENKSNPVQGKKNFEVVWKALFITVGTIVMLLSNKVYKFQTMPEFQEHKKGKLIDLLIYGIPCAIIFLGFDKLWHMVFDKLVEDHYINKTKYSQIQSRKRRSYLIAKWGYSLIYYSISFSVGYYIILDTSFMPKFLGGHGSIYTLTIYRYLEQATLSIQIYYYAQFGKHLGRLIIHCFIKPEGNYFQYSLHHSLSVFLLVFSYSMNMWVIGVFVLIVHDITDVALILPRSYKDYKNHRSSVQIVMTVFCFAIWVGFRIIIFSYCCVYGSWYGAYNAKYLGGLTVLEKEIFLLPYFFMAFMLTCLEIMHLFWTFFIIQSFMPLSFSKGVAKLRYDR